MSNTHTKLSTFPATAICANDILSSVLYVSGLVIPVAGIWAPPVMLFVGFVLFLYRGVYREVVEALPVNGGCYNALLNATSKKWAALAGVLTILSYVATAVISAKSGTDYLFNFGPVKAFLSQFGSSFGGFFSLSNNIMIGSILVLLAFALIVIAGVKDSAKVAVGIFIFHLASLSILLLAGAMYLFKGGAINYFAENSTYTNLKIETIGQIIGQGPVLSLLMVLFLGLGTSLLGVSGFESSANFVEEQKPGVFGRTLTNMMLGVSIINPAFAILFLNLLPIHEIHENATYLLSFGAEKVGGSWLQSIIVMDAFLVLCGAVLTSFVGICGLVNRMCLDGCFPLALAKANKTGSFTRIIWGFFALCVSILLITGGQIPVLGGIYAISFLSVMSMFASANLILKSTRKNLKRTYKTPAVLAIMALISTVVGLVANAVAVDGVFPNSSNLVYFLIYFVPMFGLVFLFTFRHIVLMKIKSLIPKNLSTRKFVSNALEKIVDQDYVVFIHHPKNLFNLLDYIQKNETGKKIYLVHSQEEGNKEDKFFREEIKTALPIFQNTGVFPYLDITFVEETGEFNPAMIERVCTKYDVRKNNAFIGAIHEKHDFSYDDLGGVRIVIA